MLPDFLRLQATNCLRIARTCFDLASAESLRQMAVELDAKAAELEQEQPFPRFVAGNKPRRDSRRS